MENLKEMLKHSLVLLSQVFLAHRHTVKACFKGINMQKVLKWSYSKGDLRVMGPLYTESRTATAHSVEPVQSDHCIIRLPV